MPSDEYYKTHLQISNAKVRIFCQNMMLKVAVRHGSFI